MRAFVVRPADGGLEVQELPDPTPGPDQLLVAVRAAGIIRADLLTRRGVLARARSVPGREASVHDVQPHHPLIAGNELAGEVVAVGPGVSGWAAGDRVMAIGPGYAQLAAVDAGLAVAVPDTLTWEEAGGMPVQLVTVRQALDVCANLSAGERVVVHAATSGVGMMAVAYAALREASCVVATSRSREKLDLLESFFVDLPTRLVTVDSSGANLSGALMDAMDGTGADVVVDPVGGSTLEQSVRSMAADGRIVHLGRLGGGRSAAIDLELLVKRRIQITGTSWSTRDRAEQVQMMQQPRELSPADLALLRPRIHAEYRLEDAEAAQEALAGNQHVGKLVLVAN